MPAPSPVPTRPQKVAVYARVSRAENRKHLDGQAERVSALCAARGWQVHKVVKECGSGVNDQRPRFLGLLADTSISQIVVDHQDRCSRFGVAYMQTLLQSQGRALVSVQEEDLGQADLMPDLVAIIPALTARRYGPRRATRKQHALLAVLQQEGDA